MTLPELYEALERHDWFHEMSDDASVARAGREEFIRIVDTAAALDKSGRQLFADYVVYKGSGLGCDKPQLPKPKLEDYV